MSDHSPRPPLDPRRLVRRAIEEARGDSSEQLEGVFRRMERDDASDDSKILESDSSDLVVSDESGYASSLDAGFSNSDESPTGGTLQEPRTDGESTVGLSESGEPESDAPSLSEAYPSSQRGRSTSKLTILSTPLYRPSRRAPMAVLRVFDDDQRDCESVRIRQSPFVIGRQDGDLIIGHDRQVSSRHARIDRVQEQEEYRWYLTDLKSTNGTFFRMQKVILEHDLEVLVGGELVRYVESASGKMELVRVAPHADEERCQIIPGTHYLGTDATVCLPFLRSGQFLDPQHLKLEYSRNRWNLIDLESTNHLWVAISKRTELVSGSAFQIGEQRFSFYIP